MRLESREPFCWLRRFRFGSQACPRWVLKRLLLLAAAAAGLAAAILAQRTAASLQPLPEALPPTATTVVAQPRFTARDGTALSFTYRNAWNVHDVVPYHRVPPLLRHAFILAEDQRFFRHHGVDWAARLHAVVQNLRALRKVRGASTISEQTVRILHPRPRTLWSRWLEGFEAARLEDRFSKTQILEFYLNQVPYARHRRGVAQAARAAFDRDLDTLSIAEMLALAVLVRSPSRLDLERGSEAIRRPLLQLARRMYAQDLLDAADLAEIERDPLTVALPRPAVDATHFVRFVRSRVPEASESSTANRRNIMTTLDASLQGRAQRILDSRLENLASRNVRDGALLVIDHRSDEVLAWVNSGGFADHEGGQIDKVLAPRQPGSTLKPFVYALALERGWTAATLIDDEPLTAAVGHGLHHFRNYSRTFYGPLRLRQTLANSLNIPAVRAVHFTGREATLRRLRELGFDSLTEHPDLYGDGLALGTGEVSLYALARAYAALARGGELRPLRSSLDRTGTVSDLRPRRIFNAEVSSLIADILSDPEARSLEFGHHSLLDLPVPTAIKTGTSNDYRDAWTAGFSHRYTVAVWMGNLDREPMFELTGSLGPALVLRSVFAELHRHDESAPLYLSRQLRQYRICQHSGRLPHAACPTTSEWFRRGKVPVERCPLHRPNQRSVRPPAAAQELRMASPTPGLHLAMDPRIPDDLEVFPLRLEGAETIRKVEWIVDDEVVATTSGETSYPWPLARGHHLVRARAWIRDTEPPIETARIGFLVK